MSSRTSGRRVEARAYEPADDLGDVASMHWSGWWDLRGQEPHVTELLSDPCVNFAFEEGGPHPTSRLVGVWTRLWRRKLEGKGRVRGVKLRAGALRAFVSVPAFHFANRIVPLSSVFGNDMPEIERAILAPEDDAEAFGVLEEWLRSHRLSDGQVSLAVNIVERIAKDPDITTVDRLTVVAGLGTRALQRLFREYVGASPKWVIRRNRLQEVALRLERGDDATLATLAAELGYTDHAHLARDFKNAVGKAPSEFAVTVHR